jgi:hypothetical protein
MAQFSNPKVVSDGLVFCFDMNNVKSFVGAPATNLLPGGNTNGYPSIGNGWGSYNTNQYGSGTYFSIGTVSGVSGNIVTMSAAHSLRTYDVIQPQTTGGGVTAGTNYMVQKLSSTTFSLHAYNSSQDGSQGLNTLNSVLFNQQVSINSTSFPTMWWGYPHLPNSGLVKEIIPNGFNARGRVHDCIRLHYLRPETDGMSYNVDATVTPGVAHTVSFYAKANSSTAVGKGISYQIYNYGSLAAAGYSFGFTLGEVGVWEKKTMTFTPVNANCISYWFADPGPFSWDLSEIMFNVGSSALDYTGGTRSTTEAILDLTRRNTITATSLTYASDSTFSFNGSTNYIETSNNIISGNNPFTFECFYTLTGQTGGELFGNYGSGYTSSNYIWISGMYGLYIAGSVYFPGYPLPNGTYHMACTRDGAGNCVLYKNGVQVNTGSLGGSITAGPNFRIGMDTNSAGGVGPEPFSGKIYLQRVYNRVLTAAEIKKNFDANRGRFGL